MYFPPSPTAPRSPEQPAGYEPTRRRPSGGFVRAVFFGALYIMAILALAFMASNLMQRPVDSMWPAPAENIVKALIALILVVWLALASARRLMGTRLSATQRNALRRALVGVTLACSLILPILALTLLSIQPATLLFGLLLFLLTIFFFGALYGQLWAPGASKDSGDWGAGALSATAGWLGAFIIVAVLLALDSYQVSATRDPNQIDSLAGVARNESLLAMLFCFIPATIGGAIGALLR